VLLTLLLIGAQIPAAGTDPPGGPGERALTCLTRLLEMPPTRDGFTEPRSAAVLAAEDRRRQVQQARLRTFQARARRSGTAPQRRRLERAATLILALNNLTPPAQGRCAGPVTPGQQDLAGLTFDLLFGR